MPGAPLTHPDFYLYGALYGEELWTTSCLRGADQLPRGENVEKWLTDFPGASFTIPLTIQTGKR